MAKQYKKLHPLKYCRDYLKHNIRPDGRELTQCRPVVINVGSISTSDGCAIVKVGKMTVVCGIKAELCQPKAETPDEGFLIPNVDLPPMCSQKFKPGPPSDRAQVATKVIADIIQNSGCIDLKDLCIAKERLAWCLYVDMVCLDHDGAIIDTCLIALVASLKTVKLPTVEYDPNIDSKLVNTEFRIPLRVYSAPISTTFAIFDNAIILTDPTQEEENLCTGIIQIVVKGNEICSILKPGGTSFGEEDLLVSIKQAVERSNLLMKLIDTAVQKCNDEL